MFHRTRFTPLIQRILPVALLLAYLALASSANSDRTTPPAASGSQSAAFSGVDMSAPNSWCGYRPPAEYLQEFRDAIDRGEIPDPATRALVRVAPRMQVGAVNPGPLGPDDIFPYEDTNEILRTNYSTGQLLSLMTGAANALMAEHGDQWDFIGFWMNFTPATTNGAAAFYMGVENNVSGIGTGIYNQRPGFGLAGNNIEGFVQMFDLNGWFPGTGVDADFTRLVLGQEFEHRWGVFISSPPGMPMQGNDGNCGRGAHWNFRVDGGGSGMEIADWIGASPATKLPGTLHFCSDIPDGVFSYPDLYLMGYVSPAEMDTAMAEFRYMNESPCAQQHNGVITPLSSASIINYNGARIPDVTASQKHYKTAWVMLYQPGAPPTGTQIDRALAIMEQHQTDWNVGTLGRGTMDNSIAFGNFLTSPTAGSAPLNVSFTYSSSFPTNSWDWQFGDGGTSAVENPSHVYAPGIYDVELRVGTDFGERYTRKQDHIIVWADTCTARDTIVAPNASGFIEIQGVNAVPISEYVLPFKMTNVLSKFFLDSVSFVGTRLEYFELNQVVFDNRFSGELAVRVVADNGGGSPPLPPGSGPLARLWFRSKVNSVAGDTAFVTFTTLGSQTLKAIVGTTEFIPEIVGGTVTVNGLACACPFQGDFDESGFIDAVDLGKLIDIVFFSGTDTQDPLCPGSRGDFDVDGFADAVDLAIAIDHIFFSGGPPADPCAP